MEHSIVSWRGLGLLILGLWGLGLLGAVATPAVAQVSAEIWDRDGGTGDGAFGVTRSLDALEASRAALLEARAAIDAALNEVDGALAIVRAISPERLDPALAADRDPGCGGLADGDRADGDRADGESAAVDSADGASMYPRVGGYLRAAFERVGTEIADRVGREIARWEEALAPPPPESGNEAEDAEVADAEVTDAEVADVEVKDAEVADAEVADAEVADAEVADAEVADAEVADAEVADAEVADAEVADAEVADAEVADAEVADAEVADAEVADAEVADAEVTRAEDTESGQAGADGGADPFRDGDMAEATRAQGLAVPAVAPPADDAGVEPSGFTDRPWWEDAPDPDAYRGDLAGAADDDPSDDPSGDADERMESPAVPTLPGDEREDGWWWNGIPEGSWEPCVPPTTAEGEAGAAGDGDPSGTCPSGSQ